MYEKHNRQRPNYTIAIVSIHICIQNPMTSTLASYVAS